MKNPPIFPGEDEIQVQVPLKQMELLLLDQTQRRSTGHGTVQNLEQQERDAIVIEKNRNNSIDYREKRTQKGEERAGEKEEKEARQFFESQRLQRTYTDSQIEYNDRDEAPAWFKTKHQNQKTTKLEETRIIDQQQQQPWITHNVDKPVDDIHQIRLGNEDFETTGQHYGHDELIELNDHYISTYGFETVENNITDSPRDNKQEELGKRSQYRITTDSTLLGKDEETKIEDPLEEVHDQNQPIEEKLGEVDEVKHSGSKIKISVEQEKVNELLEMLKPQEKIVNIKSPTRVFPSLPATQLKSPNSQPPLKWESPLIVNDESTIQARKTPDYKLTLTEHLRPIPMPASPVDKFWSPSIILSNSNQQAIPVTVDYTKPSLRPLKSYEKESENKSVGTDYNETESCVNELPDGPLTAKEVFKSQKIKFEDFTSSTQNIQSVEPPQPKAIGKLRKQRNPWGPKSLQRPQIPQSSLLLISPIRAILVPTTLDKHSKCRRMQDLISLTQDEIKVHDILVDLINYLNYLDSNDNSSTGRAEMKSLLEICQKRSSVSDPRLLPDSLLRRWICRIWLDVPSSRLIIPSTLEICLYWINNIHTELDVKEPVFHLLNDEIRCLGLPGLGETWLLSAFFEIVEILSGRCSRDLQHIIFLVPRDRLVTVISMLFNTSNWDPGRLLCLWISLCAYAWEPETPPLYLTVSDQGYGDTSLPLYDLMLAFVTACFYYKLPSSPNLSFDSQSNKWYSDENLKDLEIVVRGSLVEGCLRILASKASSPLCAIDAIQLLSHILISGYQPILKRPGSCLFITSLIPFFERLKFLWTATKTISRPLISLIVNLIQLLNELVRNDQLASDTKSIKSRITDMRKHVEFKPDDITKQLGNYPLSVTKTLKTSKRPTKVNSDQVNRNRVPAPWKSFIGPTASASVLSKEKYAETKKKIKKNPYFFALEELRQKACRQQVKHRMTDPHWLFQLEAQQGNKNSNFDDSLWESVPSSNHVADRSTDSLCMIPLKYLEFTRRSKLTNRSTPKLILSSPSKAKSTSFPSTSTSKSILSQVDEENGCTNSPEAFTRSCFPQTVNPSSNVVVSKAIASAVSTITQLFKEKIDEMTRNSESHHTGSAHELSKMESGRSLSSSKMIFSHKVPLDKSSYESTLHLGQNHYNDPLGISNMQPSASQQKIVNINSGHEMLVPSSPYPPVQFNQDMPSTHCHPSQLFYLHTNTESLSMSSNIGSPEGIPVLAASTEPFNDMPQINIASQYGNYPLQTNYLPNFVFPEHNQNTYDTIAIPNQDVMILQHQHEPSLNLEPMPSKIVYLEIPVPYKRAVELPFRQPRTGLQNLGNTCYLNAFLQALFVTTAFVANIFRFELEPNTHKGCEFHSLDLLKEMQILFGRLLRAKSIVLTPKDLLNTLPEFYRGGGQQDSTEAARYIFSALGGHTKNLIKTVFSGQVISKNQCGVCQSISEKIEVISDIGFPVPTEKEFEKMRAQDPNTSLSVQGLFSEYLKPEILQGDNAYHCDICKSKVTATRWTEIQSPPAHMFVVLNRFSWNSKTEERKKEKTHIEISSRIIVWNLQYRLYAVVMHQGATANSGHYYTYGCRSEPIKFKKSGSLLPSKWIKFNDSRLSKEESSKIVNHISRDPSKDDRPYILFYRCVDAPPAPPALLSPSLMKVLKKRDKQQR